jgi:hypothetical protein
MDETGLFYKVVPRYTILMPNEDVSTIRGQKKCKERCTLIVCANATGNHKITCALIGKLCLLEIGLLLYTSNKNALCIDR